MNVTIGDVWLKITDVRYIGQEKIFQALENQSQMQIQ